jgi:hypothetical protein
MFAIALFLSKSKSKSSVQKAYQVCVAFFLHIKITYIAECELHF